MTDHGRRANGEGGVPKPRSDGRWGANYTRADGKRGTAYGKTAAECRANLREKLGDTAAGLTPVSERLTVAGWLRTWLSTWIADPEHDTRTLANYTSIVERHIIPAVGNRALNGASGLGPADIKAMLNAQARAGLSGTMRQLTFDVLNNALKRAVMDGKARVNPAERVERPRRDTAKIVPWTTAQAGAFLASVEGDRLEALWNIVLLCGLRQGEVLGLRWADVDLDAGTLAVTGQLDRFSHQRKDRKGHGQAKVLVMPERVADLLRDRQTDQKREQLRAGSTWTGNPQGLVFTTRKGTPIPHNNIGESWRIRVAHVEGLPAVKFHGSRHYFASSQFEGGARLEEVAEALGHADGSTVTRLYVHLADRVRTDTADRTNAIHPRKAVNG